jgi:hypothetical protein
MNRSATRTAVAEADDVRVAHAIRPVAARASTVSSRQEASVSYIGTLEDASEVASARSQQQATG